MRAKHSIVLGIIVVLLANVRAQVTNFANFTPVSFTVERIENARGSVEQGVFIRFSSDVGRLYRLESSTDLINWSLVEQIAGSDTNMSFYVPITNMIVINGGETNNGLPFPPRFEGSSSISASYGAGATPLPYPWEPAYQPWSFMPAESCYGTMEATTTSESGAGYSNAPLANFYRITCPEDRIQFPDFEDFTEQYLYFDVWTSLSGTYTITLYQDGVQVWSNTAVVPSDGRFGVYDGGYNPADWPYTGYYSGNEFKVAVSVIAAGGTTATATATKKIRRRNRNRLGITVYQNGALHPITPAVEEEFQQWMMDYALGCAQAAYQVDLNGANVDLVDRTAVPRILDTNDWVKLKTLIGDTITDLHYFGHGGLNGIGGAGVNAGVTLAFLRSSSLRTSPLSYAFLDGCKTAENSDLLNSIVGATKVQSRQEYLNSGKAPVFAAGWKNKANVAYLNQGLLRTKHFAFVLDFYTKLTERDFGGYMQNTFENALAFAKHPNGQGVDPTIINNNEGDQLNFVGCRDCRFDEFGP